jgi:hypothetical protein
VQRDPRQVAQESMDIPRRSRTKAKAKSRGMVARRVRAACRSAVAESAGILLRPNLDIAATHSPISASLLFEVVQVTFIDA